MGFKKKKKTVEIEGRIVLSLSEEGHVNRGLVGLRQMLGPPWEELLSETLLSASFGVTLILRSHIQITIPPSGSTVESHANYVTPCILVFSLPKLAQTCMFIKHLEIMPATKKALSKYDLLLATLDKRRKQAE